MPLVNYSPEQIRGYGDSILQGGGDLQALLTAAQQYGVPLADLAGAYGMSGMQGEQYLNGNGFSAAPDGRFTNIASTNTTFGGGADKSNAINWASQLVGGDLSGYNGSNSGMNDQILGAALANGRNLGDVMSLFPQFSQADITNYYNTHQDGINAQRDAYFQGQGGAPAAGDAGGTLGGGAPTVTPGSGMPSLAGYTKNPYLDQMATGLRDQFTQFRDDGLAANRGNAVAMGNVGGSRQGIAEARTMTDAGKGYDSAIANLYGNDYNNQMNRNMQQYGIDQNAYLGGRGQDMNFYTQQRGQDQSGAALGASLYGLANNGDWSGLQNASGIYGQYSGLGGSTTGGTEQGGGASGLLGGALAGASFGKQMGWWG